MFLMIFFLFTAPTTNIEPWRGDDVYREGDGYTEPSFDA